MSGFEVVGLVLGAATLAIDTIAGGQKAYETLLLTPGLESLVTARRRTLTKEHGYFKAQILLIALPDVLRVMDRIEQYVLHGQSDHATHFMESFFSSFNMVGVAVRSIFAIITSHER
jgi:hypothetical protein